MTTTTAASTRPSAPWTNHDTRTTVDDSSSQRIAGVCAIASAPIAFASTAVILSGAEWDSTIFETPTHLLDFGSAAAAAARLGMVLDVIGYYALLVPALLVLHRAMARRRPDLAGIATLAGAAYIIVGATGAAILSAVWPAALNDINSAGSDASAITTSFDTMTNAVFAGMWNLIGSTAVAVWLIIVGRLAWNTRRPFAAYSVIVGISAAVDAAATAFDLETVSSISLQVYLYSVPIWAAWLGINLVRGTEVIRRCEPAA